MFAGGALRDPSSPGWSRYRGAVALYMTITGIVFAVLLSDVEVGLPAPWVDTVLHRLLPLAVVADWLLDPPRPAPTYRTALAFLAFPLGYFAYSLIRGPIADWYPYPFMDPRGDGSYGEVLVTAVILAVCMAGLTCLMAWINRRLVLHRARVHDEVV